MVVYRSKFHRTVRLANLCEIGQALLLRDLDDLRTKESWSYQFFSPFTVGQEWLIRRQVFSQIFKVLRWYRWFLMEVFLLSILLSFNLSFKQFLICIDCRVWFTGEFHREYQWSAGTLENMWGWGWEKTTLLHLTSILHCQGVFFSLEKSR